jgi:hypothetical protein
MSYEEQEIVLLSKDNTEFKVKFGMVMSSETIKALSSFPEEEEDREDVSLPPQHESHLKYPPPPRV